MDRSRCRTGCRASNKYKSRGEWILISPWTIANCNDSRWLPQKDQKRQTHDSWACLFWFGNPSGSNGNKDMHTGSKPAHSNRAHSSRVAEVGGEDSTAASSTAHRLEVGEGRLRACRVQLVRLWSGLSAEPIEMTQLPQRGPLLHPDAKRMTRRVQQSRRFPLPRELRDHHRRSLLWLHRQLQARQSFRQSGLSCRTPDATTIP
jgi:hypothetical protein